MNAREDVKSVKGGVVTIKVFDIKKSGSRASTRIFNDGNKKIEASLVKEVTMKNVICLQASKLIAQHMYEGSTVSVPGATHLAVGIGSGWDPTNPPAATENQTTLVNELYRKAYTGVAYLTAGGAVSPSRTSIVQFSTEFGLAEANGVWLEMGLFGGTGASSTNGGDEINYLTFPAITKTASLVFTVEWRISF